MEVNPNVDSLDQFVESLARAGFFPDGLDHQCEVEISLTKRSNMGEYYIHAPKAKNNKRAAHVKAEGLYLLSKFH